MKSSLINHFKKTLHLVFHYGEHYSSLRNLGDDGKDPAEEIFLDDVVEGEDEDDASD